MNTNEYETIINYLSGRNATEETAEKSTTEEETKENSRQEVPETPEEKVITLDDVQNIDKLVEIYNKGKEKVKFPPWVQPTDKGLKIVAQELYIFIKENYNILTVKLGNAKGVVLYIYRNGKYELLTESEAKAIIKSHFPTSIRKPSDTDNVYKELITDFVNIEEQDLNADEDIINFKNGILKLSTGELLPHSPEYISTIQIPYNYIPNLSLSQAPYTLKFLNDFTGGNTEETIMLCEYICAIISNVQGWRYKKCLILVGPGNTGKSLLREYIQNIVGIENTFTVDFNQLNSQFGSAGITGKRLIGCR